MFHFRFFSHCFSEEDKGPKGGLDEALEQCCGYARSDFNLDRYGTLWFKLGLLVTPDTVQLLLLVDLRRVPFTIFTALKEREASITVYNGSQEVRAVLLQHLFFYPPHEPAQAFQRSLAFCEIVPLAVNAFRIMRTFMGLAFIPAEISGNEGLIVSKWENGAFLFYKVSYAPTHLLSLTNPLPFFVETLPRPHQKPRATVPAVPRCSGFFQLAPSATPC